MGTVDEKEDGEVTDDEDEVPLDLHKNGDGATDKKTSTIDDLRLAVFRSVVQRKLSKKTAGTTISSHTIETNKSISSAPITESDENYDGASSDMEVETWDICKSDVLHMSLNDARSDKENASTLLNSSVPDTGSLPIETNTSIDDVKSETLHGVLFNPARVSADTNFCETNGQKEAISIVFYFKEGEQLDSFGLSLKELKNKRSKAKNAARHGAGIDMQRMAASITYWQEEGQSTGNAVVDSKGLKLQNTPNVIDSLKPTSTATVANGKMSTVVSLGHPVALSSVSLNLPITKGPVNGSEVIGVAEATKITGKRDTAGKKKVQKLTSAPLTPAQQRMKMIEDIARLKLEILMREKEKARRKIAPMIAPLPAPVKPVQALAIAPTLTISPPCDTSLYQTSQQQHQLAVAPTVPVTRITPRAGMEGSVTDFSSTLLDSVQASIPQNSPSLSSQGPVPPKAFPPLGIPAPLTLVPVLCSPPDGPTELDLRAAALTSRNKRLRVEPASLPVSAGSTGSTGNTEEGTGIAEMRAALVKSLVIPPPSPVAAVRTTAVAPVVSTGHLRAFFPPPNASTFGRNRRYVPPPPSSSDVSSARSPTPLFSTLMNIGAGLGMTSVAPAAQSSSSSSSSSSVKAGTSSSSSSNSSIITTESSSISSDNSASNSTIVSSSSTSSIGSTSSSSSADLRALNLQSKRSCGGGATAQLEESDRKRVKKKESEGCSSRRSIDGPSPHTPDPIEFHRLHIHPAFGCVRTVMSLLSLSQRRPHTALSGTVDLRLFNMLGINGLDYSFGVTDALSVAWHEDGQTDTLTLLEDCRSPSDSDSAHTAPPGLQRSLPLLSPLTAPAVELVPPNLSPTLPSSSSQHLSQDLIERVKLMKLQHKRKGSQAAAPLHDDAMDVDLDIEEEVEMGPCLGFGQLSDSALELSPVLPPTAAPVICRVSDVTNTVSSPTISKVIQAPLTGFETIPTPSSSSGGTPIGVSIEIHAAGRQNTNLDLSDESIDMKESRAEGASACSSDSWACTSSENTTSSTDTSAEGTGTCHSSSSSSGGDSDVCPASEAVEDGFVPFPRSTHTNSSSTSNNSSNNQSDNTRTVTAAPPAPILVLAAPPASQKVSGSVSQVQADEMQALRLREAQLKTALEVQTIRRSIDIYEKLFMYQATKLTAARALAIKMRKAEVEQGVIVQRLLEEKSQCLLRATKADLSRIELMCEISSARFEDAESQRLPPTAFIPSRRWGMDIELLDTHPTPCAVLSIRAF